MALTQDQWFEKIKKFVPSWYFEKYVYAPAVFKAVAAVFQAIQEDTDDAQASTFILQSAAPVDDLHGDERNLPRGSGESDGSYNFRIQNALFVPVGGEQLQILIDNDLNNGNC